MSSYSSEPDLNALIEAYAPRLSFCHDEVCYPISIDKYLSVCQVEDRKNPHFLDSHPTSQSLYNLNQLPPSEHDFYLNFKDPNWLEILKGQPKHATSYVKVIRQNSGDFIFIYIYLYSHTEPYQLCNCLCPLTAFAHRGDIKFNAVFVSNKTYFPIQGVYFGAHGQKAGQYVDADHLRFDGSHPIAFPCHGDHSNYNDPRCYPRIYFCVYDRCESLQICQPQIIRVYDQNEPEFRPELHGWTYFPGHMSADGIDSPANQSLWTANFSITNSNNWFRRLFCCAYF